MKKLIPICLLLVFASAGAAWWFLLRAPEAKASGGAEAAVSTAPSFLELQPLTIPVVRESAVERMLRVSLTLELAGAEASGRATDALPRLTDAFVVELYGLLGRRQMAERQYDTGIIKRRLQAVSDRVLGPGTVTNVLVQGLAIAHSR
jgi:flagellar basal body-associated protein FliL